MNRFHISIFCVLASVALGSCSKNSFAKYGKLGDLRVLALIVDQPEVAPGTVVNITPVLSDLNGAGRALTYTVQACIDPGIGIGASPICQTPDSTNTHSGSVTIPAGASSTYTDAVTSFPVTTPDQTTIFTAKTPADQYNGVAYLVFYTISSGTGESVTSFVRVMVSGSAKTTKNQNPTITSINANDSAISSPLTMPTSATNFSAISPASAVESYQVMSPTGALATQTEELVNTWFVSDGEFDFQRTLSNSENSWAPPDSKPSSRGLVLMVITRDSHNGATYKKIEMN